MQIKCDVVRAMEMIFPCPYQFSVQVCQLSVWTAEMIRRQEDQSVGIPCSLIQEFDWYSQSLIMPLEAKWYSLPYPSSS